MGFNATVCAIATPPAMGGIGILRLSGSDALSASIPLVSRVPPRPTARHAYFTSFVDRQGRLLDEGLFLFFSAPQSFTGEDVVELHAHGSVELLSLLQREVLKDERVRTAEPGEFTRRAFLNGRMDLARAEAVAALVAADSEAAVRAAASQLHGSLSRKVRAVRKALLEVSADIEGVLNFPEEAGGADAGISERLLSLTGELRRMASLSSQGHLLQKAPRVTLFGPTNAGKSSLFNHLLGDERALVDAEPGTTRDVLEARLQLGDLGVWLVDTAGLRESTERLEVLGMNRAREALRRSQLGILVLPPGASQDETQHWLAEAEGVPVLQVEGKADLNPWVQSLGPLKVSAKTGLGVQRLLGELTARLWEGRAPESLWLSTERQREALVSGLNCLEMACRAVREATLDVVAGEVTAAVALLGAITGEGASNELLDSIFHQFCIGK